MSKEQDCYDLLKQMQTDELIKEGTKLQLKIHNYEIKLHMIKNILINRGEDSHKVNAVISYYGRFEKVD